MDIEKKRYAIMRGGEVWCVEEHEQIPEYFKSFKYIEVVGDTPLPGYTYNETLNCFVPPAPFVDPVQLAIDAYTLELVKEGIL